MEAEPEKSVDGKRSSSKCLAAVVASFVPVLAFFGVVIAIQYAGQQHLKDEVAFLRTEIDSIKLQIYSSQVRYRRDAESDPGTDPDSGFTDGVPIIYDSPYGVDLGHKQSLSVYPTLQGDLKKKDQAAAASSSSQRTSFRQESFQHRGSGSSGGGDTLGGGTTTARPNYNYHYLGIHRHISNEDPVTPVTRPPPPIITSTTPMSAKSSNSSAYAKRIHTFRHSRVSQTVKQEGEDQPQPLPQVVVTDQREQLQFQAAIPESISPPFKKPELRTLDNSDDDDDDLVSVHLQAKVSVADESSSHLVTGLHDSWRVSKWSKLFKGSKLFRLDESLGQISVSQTGLYLVYAQVEYLDNHEVNGYEVYLNNEPFISCVTSTHTPKERKKHNTCYTAAVVYIEDGGVLHVRDKEAGRYSLLHSSGTFFGATKIAPQK